jgi:hypothetical protein
MEERRGEDIRGEIGGVTGGCKMQTLAFARLKGAETGSKPDLV